MINRRTLFVRFVRRGRRTGPAIKITSVKPGKWNYVATTYDKRTRMAKLYVNNRFFAKKIGRFTLATNYPVRMGASKIYRRRSFLGAISCVQVYRQALSASQIFARKTRCFTGTYAILCSDHNSLPTMYY